ncbi:MAG: MBL fold metallo-hydrolase [Deltaproteobacteria bacterium]|nr:MBL fold metallo-hydrolase [Deltaproteobacteria bacterium]
MKITFCGAAGEVTGSCFLVETGRDKVLVDCGMFQGAKDLVRLNYEAFRFDPKAVSHVVLTHAHIDHSGLVPKLFNHGFKGTVLGTNATVDLCAILLEDSAHVQKNEIESENRRRLRTGLPAREPLYSEQEARECIDSFQGLPYGEQKSITDSIDVRYQDAGHILGSSILEMTVREHGLKRKVVFSGDIGQWGVPIVRDPTLVSEADVLIIESTYGDRLHEGAKDRDRLLLDRVKEAYGKGGKLMIPAFSVERTQELIYSMYKSMKAGLFPDEKIFLDSPLAIKATEIFKRHRECFDQEALHVFTRKMDIPNLVYCRTAEDSMRLNDYQKPCVIIAGSGMCNAGRIRHHLKHGLWNPKNTVLFVGFQAVGTLGRVILDGAREVRMMGTAVAVGADIHRIGCFSAHADRDELLKWAGGFKKKPQNTFVVHGEPQPAAVLAGKLRPLGFNPYVPKLGEAVEV